MIIPEPTDAQIDVLFNTIDDLLLNGDFDQVNQILRDVDIKQTSIVEIVCYLSLTLAAYSQLSYRSEFYDAVKQEIIARDRNTDTLLQGLEYPTKRI